MTMKYLFTVLYDYFTLARLDQVVDFTKQDEMPLRPIFIPVMITLVLADGLCSNSISVVQEHICNFSSYLDI